MNIDVNIENLARKIRLLSYDISDNTARKTSVIHDNIVSVVSEQARENFQRAVYDGNNDVYVTTANKRERGYRKTRISAKGESVVFIEFGTGYKYLPQSHRWGWRLPFEHGSIAGTFGKKQGLNEHGWYYKGTRTGTNGVRKGNTPYVHTYGNPANRCLYNAVMKAKEQLPDIIRKAGE